MKTTSNSHSARRKFWNYHISRFKKTTLNKREYCRQEGLAYWSFCDWYKRLNAQESDQSLTRVLETSQPALPSSLHGTIQIQVDSQITIHVPEGFSSEHLQKILKCMGVTV